MKPWTLKHATRYTPIRRVTPLFCTMVRIKRKGGETPRHDGFGLIEKMTEDNWTHYVNNTRRLTMSSEKIEDVPLTRAEIAMQRMCHVQTACDGCPMFEPCSAFVQVYDVESAEPQRQMLYTLMFNNATETFRQTPGLQEFVEKNSRANHKFDHHKGLLAAFEKEQRSGGQANGAED